MERTEVTSSSTEKLLHTAALLAKGDLRALWSSMQRFLRHRLKEQWRLVYFFCPLDAPVTRFTVPENLVVRRAVPHDTERIVREIFPWIGEQEANDKRYVSLLGHPGIHCFLGEDEGILAHYCWVFERALASPLAHTPFNMELLTEHDAYIGPAFTTPPARGKWLFPCAIAAALTHLRTETEVTRAILCVHRDNPGGVAFFRRLGFQVIERSTQSVFFARIWNAHPKLHG